MDHRVAHTFRTCVASALFAASCLLWLPGQAQPFDHTGVLKNLDGTPFTETTQAKAALTVYVFISNECPISNRYAPEYQRWVEAYGKRGVNFRFIHPVIEETLKEIREHTASYSIPGLVLADPTQQFARRCGVRVTPEVVVVTSEGRQVYRGRIDDRFPSLTQHRPQAMQRELRDALDRALSGNLTFSEGPPAVGCRIQFQGAAKLPPTLLPQP